MSRILLFEKNSFIRESLHQILQKRFSSLTVKEVICFEDCLNAMGEFRPDILILGITANYDEGLQCLKQIRKEFPKTVIILFTTYDAEEYRKEAILKGANHVISMERWTVGEILALVQTVLVTKKSWDRSDAEHIPLDKETLRRPIERRRKDARGMALEKKYLEDNPERRNNKQCS